MNIVTIHQPEHLSYLGIFHKISMCNTYVILDTVQYVKNHYGNRNIIYGKTGSEYLTVPVKAHHDPYNKILISDEFYKTQLNKNIKTLEISYKKSPYFNTYFNSFIDVYSNKYETISDMNIALIKWVLNILNIDVNIIYAHDLNPIGKKTDLLIDILNKVNADKYISGKSGEDYLEFEKFTIPVEIQHFNHPCYTQYGHTEFISYLSVIDAIFNVGPEIMNIIKKLN